MTPIIFLTPLMIPYVHYTVIISEFEEKCRENSMRDNMSEKLCVWSGGPPKKPVFEKWFSQI